jgi:hypothetical protein
MASKGLFFGSSRKFVITSCTLIPYIGKEDTFMWSIEDILEGGESQEVVPDLGLSGRLI